MPPAQSYDQARTQIERLTERFARNLDAYTRVDYKEARARAEFIDPLFEALGWDVRNTRGCAEQYKDVVHEDALKVSGTVQAPDYCFRIGGTRKFFLEAKKPSISVKGDVGPAYQLRRYAWSAKLPLNILTDFEEFAVYDCRQRPRPGDKAGVARILYFTYDQYPDCFDQVYGVFARQSVLEGSFDRYVQDTRRKRGTSEVDAEFLKEIEGWREILARNLALRNPGLSVHELNYAVQRTIDRIIFLRMADDRGIEEYGRLMALTNGPHTYARLTDTLYRQADEKYNSGLFDFKADTLTTTLQIDDKALKPILTGLYYPQCPYEFSVLPAEVLGQVYEQFLGKVIRLTPAHRAVVEEKPEVKKAGGVYYTPSYIVEYIVRQTVGKLTEGKSPRQLRGTRGNPSLRVLDPACGSGSFLLGAYQYLLDHYRQWYEENDPEQHAGRKEPPVYQGAGGGWRLTTAEKKRILLDHIYGVDIDRQAVEVTKLSLLLQVLEGETEQTLGQQLSFWRQRALPDLESNCKCGNSLIRPDYFQDQLLPDEVEMRRVNPFDWQREFPEAMAAGGFDAVIGNPPYVRQEMLKQLKPYFEQRFSTYQSTADLYVYFMEKSLRLLKTGGRYSIIVSRNFLHTSYAANLRRFITEEVAILGFVDFGGLAVFENAKDTYVCIPILACEPQIGQVEIVSVKSLKVTDIQAYAAQHTSVVSPDRFSAITWSLRAEEDLRLLDKICGKGAPLGVFLDGGIYSGIKTGLNKAFVIETVARGQLASQNARCKALLRPYYSGMDIRRYFARDTDRYLIVIPNGWTRAQMARTARASSGISEARAWSWFKSNYGALADHLEPFAADARRRQDQGEYWWELRPCDYYSVFDRPKIIYPDIAKGPRFFLDSGHAYLSNTAYCLASDDHSLLGILNSKVFWFVIGNISIPFGIRAGEYRYRLIYQYMEHVPIRTIDFDDSADVARHDRMVALVERMLNLHKKLAAATIPAEKALYQRQIEATDREIDALVYELYELTDEEIAIVEGQKT